LLRAAEREQATLIEDLERAEYSKLQGAPFCGKRTGFLTWSLRV
jgi:hypothetical protein